MRYLAFVDGVTRGALRLLISFSLVFSSLIIAGCGSSGHVDDRGTEVVIDGHKLDSIINKSGRYNVYLTGTSNNIVIAEKKSSWSHTCDRRHNDLSIRNSAMVEQIDLEGEGNTLYIPKGFVSRISRVGVGNKIIEK